MGMRITIRKDTYHSYFGSKLLKGINFNGGKSEKFQVEGSDIFGGKSEKFQVEGSDIFCSEHYSSLFVDDCEIKEIIEYLQSYLDNKKSKQNISIKKIKCQLDNIYSVVQELQSELK